MSAPQRYLFVTLSNIGDAVMTTPVLEALHRHAPQAVIDIVADRRCARLFEHCPYRGRILLRDKRAGLLGSLRLLATLRRERYALVVDLRTDGAARLLRAERVLDKRGVRTAGVHAVERHFAVLGPWLGEAPIPPAAVWLTPALRAEARARLGGFADGRVLALAPGANWPGKIWPASRWRELVTALAGEIDAVVLLGSAAERRLTAAVAAGLPVPALDFAGATDLLQAAALAELAAGFVGNDSGLGHLAAAAGTPTLVVFGVGEPQRYRPWGAHTDYVVAPGRVLPSLEGRAVADRLRALWGRAAAPEAGRCA